MPRKKPKKLKSKGKSMQRITSGVLLEQTVRVAGKGRKKGKVLKKSKTLINARELS